MIDEYFSKRRTCRFFKKGSISPVEIENIISKAAKAPTCGNMQLYSVIVTTEEEKKAGLANFHYNQPASTTAPVILTVCADFNRFTKWCEANNAKPGYDNFHSFITALIDALIFTQQIVTIAEQEGYGTCYLGTVTYNAKEISDFLQLPSLVVPVASIAVGEPEKEGEETERLPVEGILHYEKYNDYSLSDIKKIYKIHDEDPRNDKFIKENNKENIAQVFTDIRYPKSLNEQVSESFFSLLKNKGFVKDGSRLEI